MKPNRKRNTGSLSTRQPKHVKGKRFCLRWGRTANGKAYILEEYSKLSNEIKEDRDPQMVVAGRRDRTDC